MRLLSLFFGQRFRSPKWLHPRPDQVVSLRLERVGRGIPSRPLAVGGVDLVQAPEKQAERGVNYKGETEGVPLFTSPMLNISGIEVDYRGLEVVRSQR